MSALLKLDEWREFKTDVRYAETAASLMNFEADGVDGLRIGFIRAALRFAVRLARTAGLDLRFVKGMLDDQWFHTAAPDVVPEKETN